MELYLFVVMCLCSYRITRFVVKDDFPPMIWLRDRLVGDWREVREVEKGRSWGADWTTGTLEGLPMVRRQRWHWTPQWLADLLSCPWCASGWLSLGVVAAGDAFVSVPLPAVTWIAVWGVASVIAAQDWA